MLLQPNGSPAKRKKVQLNRLDVKTVIEFERWCQAMGLVLDLYCQKCADTYGSGGRCWGNNSRDASVYHLECQCSDRVYGQDVGASAVTPVLHENKPMVIVP